MRTAENFLKDNRRCDARPYEAKEDHTAPAQPPANDDHTSGLGCGKNKSRLKGDILGRNNQHGRLSLRIENLLIMMSLSSK